MTTRKLLFSLTRKDFVVTWFSGSGGGGQHRNKHANCCRIQHPASGAMATGQEQRSRAQNQDAAFRRLMNMPKFRLWHARRCWELDNKTTIEEEVAQEMRRDNLKIEVKKNGKWTPEPTEIPGGNAEAAI